MSPPPPPPHLLLSSHTHLSSFPKHAELMPTAGPLLPECSWRLAQLALSISALIPRPLLDCHLLGEALHDHLARRSHTITLYCLTLCGVFTFPVLHMSCYHNKDSFICLFNVGCQGSWMTLMWPQWIQDIKREEEFPEPLVYLSSWSAGEANNPKKATEQAWRFSSSLGPRGNLLAVGFTAQLSSLLPLPGPQCSIPGMEMG